ncbi:PfkB family carbohydrate kinase [Mucilaginibacter antarcticus]|uniref:PfkB family carbohydrate kinase n=1 Tax=Mucilaginibacter antarcticus TaxID=1855725 RepID=UPI00362745A1
MVPYLGHHPALSDKAAALTLAALKAAKAKGLTTSLDLNYRKKLWTAEKARETLTQLCQYVDVCLGPDATLGFHPEDTDVDLSNLKQDDYKIVFKQLADKYGFKYIASTLRGSQSASDNSISAMIFDGTEIHHTKQYNVRIVDRVGAGDSFASGLIYGLVAGLNAAQAAEFGIAASALKHTIPGDMNHATVAEIETLIGGDGSGKIQR